MWIKNNISGRTGRPSFGRTLIVWHLNVSMLIAPCLFSGCASSRQQWDKTVRNDTSEIDRVTRQIDNPSPGVINQVSMTAEPVTALTLAAADVTYVDMQLNSVLELAMQHSTILRDIGGIVLRSPDAVNTGFATRMQETDPRFGMEAALSAFDAQFAASANFNNNNRVFNNSFFAGGATSFKQDLHDYQAELSKRTATGSLLAIRGVSGYDSNNAPANTFTSSWDTWLEGEIRQPLLQGGGLEFNRIAGPGSTPGVYNGVLIAKANSDINHSEFMASLRGFVSNVENAYWDLYTAYRELDARKKAMEKALVLWNEAKAKAKAGTTFDADEALARQQYYQLKADVDEALSGRLLQGTHIQNGSSGGTMRMTGGVLVAERRLRLLTGMTAADGQLLRTIDEPTMAPIHFDWHAAMDEAVRQRPELQRQHLVVKKKEMELLASKNFLNPRLDAVGRYRWRGFGDDLIASGTQTGTSPASAFGNFATGDQQEWTLGVELSVPIGYRKAHASVQHAEIALCRARAIQKEQQREVVSDLNGAITDAVRAYQSVENSLNQYLAAKDYLSALEQRKQLDMSDGTDRVLDAQRRLLQSEIWFFRARAEYAVALKNVHYEKGSLLRYKDMRVADSDTSYNDYSPPIDGTIYESAPAAMEIDNSHAMPIDGVTPLSLPDVPASSVEQPSPIEFAPPAPEVTSVAPQKSDHFARDVRPPAVESQPAAVVTVSNVTPAPQSASTVSTQETLPAPTQELAPLLGDSPANGGTRRLSNRDRSPTVPRRSPEFHSARPGQNSGQIRAGGTLPVVSEPINAFRTNSPGPNGWKSNSEATSASSRPNVRTVSNSVSTPASAPVGNNTRLPYAAATEDGN